MSPLVLAIVIVLSCSAAGVVVLDRRVRAEVEQLDRVAVELRLLRAALDRLRAAMSTTRDARSRIVGRGRPDRSRQ